MPGVRYFPRVVNERCPSLLGLDGKTHIGHMKRRKQAGTDQETTSLWVDFIVQEGALETAAAGVTNSLNPALNSAKSNNDWHQETFREEFKSNRKKNHFST